MAGISLSVKTADRNSGCHVTCNLSSQLLPAEMKAAVLEGVNDGIMTGVLALVAIGSILTGLMFGGLPSAIIGYVVRNTSPETFGPSFAAATFAFGVAQVASPQVGGLIADVTGGFTMVFVIAIAFAVCGSIASTRLPSTR